MKLFSKKIKKISITVAVIVFSVGLGYVFSQPSFVLSTNPDIAGQEVFKNWETEWISSDTGITDDPYRSFMQLTPLVFASNGAGRGSNFVDINGDGLVDLLYLGQDTSHSNTGAYTGWIQRIAVLINNGNRFDVVYKCVIRNDTISQFYGDCAAQ